MQIITFINPHRLSNTYLVFSSVDRKAFLIDIGDMDIKLIEAALSKHKLSLEAVFLTHEHTDHCFGVDVLAANYDFDLYCTMECAAGLASPKLNFSRYLPDIEEFVVEKSPTIIGKEKISISSNLKIYSIPTPGHSPGSCCFIIDDKLFTGDTLMATKTPLSFPNSNRKLYERSLEIIKRKLTDVNWIYPGHGDIIDWNNQDFNLFFD